MLRAVGLVFDLLPTLGAFSSYLNVGGGQPESDDASNRTPSGFCDLIEDVEVKITHPIIFYLKRIKISFNALNLVGFHECLRCALPLFACARAA